VNFIGIDPGKGGAIAVIDNDGCAIATATFSEEAYKCIISENKGSFAIVEDVHAMPKQGVTSMFNFGYNKGWIMGLLYANAIPTELVSPQKWKKIFSLNGEKQKSIERAKQLFPCVSLLATPRCKKAHDGLAEALLMAEYARRIWKRNAI
jgi:crossover junction endodeoxyribonuclease RuvC